MQLRLDLFLAKCDIEYDDIVFYKDCFIFSYKDLVSKFDISTLCVNGFYVDKLLGFIVIVDLCYINYP